MFWGESGTKREEEEVRRWMKGERRGKKKRKPSRERPISKGVK